MNAPWIRVPPRARDTFAASLVAGVVAAGVGLVTFYLARTILAREPLEETHPPGTRGEARGGGARGA